MTVRSRPLLALGVALLVSAGVLGGLLVHDGEVGTDEALLERVGPGDVVRLKGALRQEPGLDNLTYRLEAPVDMRVLVTSSVPVPDGTYVVEGEVVLNNDGALVLSARSLAQPFLFG